MVKIVNDVYEHRGKYIAKDGQGIFVAGHLELFPSWDDARYFVDKLLDGISEKEPRIIGKWRAMK